MTDRLTLTRALESSGMQSEAAERIATEIYDAIHDKVRASLIRSLPQYAPIFGAQAYELLTESIEGLWFRAELAPAMALRPWKELARPGGDFFEVFANAPI